MFSQESLGNYYETMFAMKQHHNYEISDLENMIPWERQVYVNMLNNHLELEQQRAKAEQYKR